MTPFSNRLVFKSPNIRHLPVTPPSPIVGGRLSRHPLTSPGAQTVNSSGGRKSQLVVDEQARGSHLPPFQCVCVLNHPISDTWLNPTINNRWMSAGKAPPYTVSGSDGKKFRWTKVPTSRWWSVSGVALTPFSMCLGFRPPYLREQPVPRGPPEQSAFPPTGS